MAAVAPRASLGVSLVEVVIAVAVVSIMTAVTAVALGPWIAFRQGMETERRLKELEQAMEAAYRDNALAMEGTSAAELAYPGGAIADGTVASAATFQAVAGYSSLSSASLAQDGFNRPVRIRVSPRLSRSVDGATLYCHMAAVISGGRNGSLEAGSSFDASTGGLTLAGDDKGFVLDGCRLQRELFDLTASRMRRAAEAWERYYESRYLADPGRSVSIDYFGRPGTPAERWDPGNGVAHSGGAAAPASALNLGGALGLSAADLADAYGQELLADNSSSLTRNPGNPDPSMASPPYTARVLAALPGGVTFAVSAVSAY